MEEENGVCTITESYTKRMNEMAIAEENSKYGQLNLLMLAKDMQDEKTTLELMERYAYLEYMEQHLFSMIKS